MRTFFCSCGQRVFFESKHCVNCGTELGFDPAQQTMIALQRNKDNSLSDAVGNSYRSCCNGTDYDVCNWLIADQRPAVEEGAKDVAFSSPFCFGCSFNRTIPHLGNPANLVRWQKIESAKKRLIFTLKQLHLPLNSGHQNHESGLLFDFIEDERSDPVRYPESFASTGHHNGLITINVLEADDAAREKIKLELNEHYRTLLGHLRHESGHYYWQLAEQQPSLYDEFVACFGDPKRDYSAALTEYYNNGPVQGWQNNHISAYASSHPLEDWAETWGHYLHIFDSLDTAAAFNAMRDDPAQMNCAQRIAQWADLSIALNEFNRSSGLADAYPFVLNEAIKEKLLLVDRVIRAIAEPG